MSLRSHNHQKLHDPTYIGPGIWFNMHLDAVTAYTKSDQNAVIARIRKLQSRFPCSKCKVHFGEYLERHPPEQISGASGDSLFRWSVDFHNAVNSFTGKSQVSYAEARTIYVEESIFCTADCTETTEPQPPLVSKSGSLDPFVPLVSKPGSLDPFIPWTPLGVSRDPFIASTSEAPTHSRDILRYDRRNPTPPEGGRDMHSTLSGVRGMDVTNRGWTTVSGKAELGYVLVPVGPRR